MAHNKLYRNFIILQEDDRSKSSSNDKALSGYAKIEAKGDKCKITFYAQNLKKDDDYAIVLICYKKDMKQIIDMGPLTVNEVGKGEACIEYYSDNIAGLNLGYDKISGAGICKKKSGSLDFSMYGFMNGEKLDDGWKKMKIVNCYDKSSGVKPKEYYKKDDDKKCKDKKYDDKKDDKKYKDKKCDDKDDHDMKDYNKGYCDDKKHNRDDTIIENDIIDEIQDNHNEDCNNEDYNGVDCNQDRDYDNDEDSNMDDYENRDHKKCSGDKKDHKKCDSKKKDYEKCGCKKKDYDKDECGKKDHKKHNYDDCDHDDCEKECDKKNYKDHKCQCGRDDLENNFEEYERKIEEQIVDAYDFNLRGGVGNFFENLVKDFEEVKGGFKELPYCKWFKIPVNDIEDMCNSKDYNKYSIIYYPMLNYYPYIKKYGYFMIGYKCDSKGNLKYLVYAIPGKKDREEQPYCGKSGFVTWCKRDCDRNGFWLMFYDYKNSTVVVPSK